MNRNTNTFFAGRESIEESDSDTEFLERDWIFYERTTIDSSGWHYESSDEECRSQEQEEEWD
jgi:hypothetical protein